MLVFLCHSVSRTCINIPLLFSLSITCPVFPEEKDIKTFERNDQRKFETVGFSNLKLLFISFFLALRMYYRDFLLLFWPDVSEE